jgi:hypothetical protein
MGNTLMLAKGAIWDGLDFKNQKSLSQQKNN